MRPAAPRILFITGTDTGVGKTLLTALLLDHLRRSGRRAFALKPFCSGSRADAELLHALQDGDLTLDEVNPFYFCEPVAPLVSSRRHRRRVPLRQVVRQIRAVASRIMTDRGAPERHPPAQHSRLRAQSWLLIEGSGGVLVPLGEAYTVADLIEVLRCEVIVVSRNRLGTLNHTLLTVGALKNQRRALRVKVVLMSQKKSDLSCASNARILAELLAPTPVLEVPFIRGNPLKPRVVKKNAKKIKKTLARIAG